MCRTITPPPAALCDRPPQASGIRNDPNDWAREHDDPRYIIDLIKRVVRVSLETIKIVRTLPALNEKTAQ